MPAQTLADQAEHISHLFFTSGLVLSTFLSYGLLIHFCIKQGKKLIAKLPARPQPEQNTLITPTLKPQRMSERPVCWRVRVSFEQKQGDTTLMADVFATSRRGDYSFRWNRGEQTLLEALEVGLHHVYPHFMANDNVVVLVPDEAQMAFNFETEEPHDKMVVERITKFLTTHHQGEHKFENINKVAPAAKPAASKPQPAPAAQPVVAAAAPAPAQPVVVAKVAAVGGGGSLPPSSPAFGNFDDSVHNF